MERKNREKEEPKILGVEEQDQPKIESIEDNKKVEKFNKEKEFFKSDILSYLKEGFLKKKRGVKEWRDYNKEEDLLSKGKKILELFDDDDVIRFYGDRLEEDKKFVIDLLNRLKIDGIKIIEQNNGSEK